MRCTTMEQMEQALLAEKEGDANKIPYRFTMLDDYP